MNRIIFKNKLERKIYYDNVCPTKIKYINQCTYNKLLNAKYCFIY